jgi:hypothetical protein
MAVPPPHFPAAGAVILGSPDWAVAAIMRHFCHDGPGLLGRRSDLRPPILGASADRACLAGHSRPRRGLAAAAPSAGACPDRTLALPVSTEPARPGPHPGNRRDDKRRAVPRSAEHLPGPRHHREIRRPAIQARAGAWNWRGRRAGTQAARPRLLPVTAPVCTAPEITSPDAGAAIPQPLSHVVAARPCCRTATRQPPLAATKAPSARADAAPSGVSPGRGKSQRTRRISRSHPDSRLSPQRNTRGIRACGQLVRRAGEGVHGA